MKCIKGPISCIYFNMFSDLFMKATILFYANMFPNILPSIWLEQIILLIILCFLGKQLVSVEIVFFFSHCF